MKLNLPNVTLVAIDTVCHDLTLLAIDECQRHATFGDVKFFTDMLSYKEAIHINSFSCLQDGVDFTTFTLPKYIRTSHMLSIQWDSWIIDPKMWTDEFLEYDYIGAPWWHKEFNVGNSGFCLRSKALMDYMATHATEFPLTSPEDDLLCRHYQPSLPFKWAPESVASKFSFERSRPSIDSRHFGFHGIFNWPFVMPPDKLAERMSIARHNKYLEQSGQLARLDAIHAAHWHKIGG